MKQVIIEILVEVQHEMKSDLFWPHYPHDFELKLGEREIVDLIIRHFLLMIALIVKIKSIGLHYNIFCLVIEVNKPWDVLIMCLWTRVCREDRERAKVG